MAPTPLAFPELVKRMEGRDTLNQWDVLVSYDEDTVNALLKARAQQTGLFQQITLPPVVTKDDINGEDVTHVISLTISTATLVFLDATNQVQLLLAFAGHEVLTFGNTTKTNPIPPGYQINITTSLVHCPGTVEEDGTFTVDQSAEPLPSGDIVIFPSTGVGAYGVCIDLVKPDTVVVEQIQPPIDGSSLGQAISLDSLISSSIRTLFQTAAHRKLYLVASRNTPSPAPDGSIMFQPESFQFSCIPGDSANGAKAVLCTWMTLKGSGATPQSGTTLSFLVPDADGSSVQVPGTPIPAGCSASVLISHDAFVKVFLTPALTKEKGFTSLKMGDATQTAGITTQLGVPSQILGFDSSEHHKPFEVISNDGLSINTSDTLATLRFDSGIITKTNNRTSFTYATPQTAIEFVDEYRVGGGDRETASPLIGFELSANVAWNDTTTETPQLVLDLANDYTLNVTPASGISDWPSFCNDNPLPTWISFAQLVAPAACSLGKASLPALNLLLTTNLLFPGQHVFKGHNVLSETDQSPTGMALPRDVILTGMLSPPSTTQIVNSVTRLQTLSVMPTKAQTNDTASPADSLEKFKDELWNSADTALLFAIANAGKADSKTTITSLLASKGYGDLTPDHLLAGMGLTARNVLGQSTQTNATPETAPPLDIDLRYFGGIYKVTSPAADAGKLVLIDPFKKSIRILGVDTVPTQQIDKTSGRRTNEFVSTVQGKEYHLLVKTEVDPSTGDITKSLGGSVHGDATETFAAEWKDIDTTDTAVIQLTFSDAGNEDLVSAANLEDLGSWRDKFFSVISLLCCCCGSGQHAGEQAAAEAEPEAPRAPLIRREISQQSAAQLDRSMARLRALQRQVLTQEALEIDQQAMDASYQPRHEAVRAQVTDVDLTGAVEAVDASARGYDAGIAENPVFQRSIQQSRDLAINAHERLLNERIPESDAGQIEQAVEDADIASPAESRAWMASAASAASNDWAEERFAKDGVASHETAGFLITTLSQRFAAQVDDIKEMIQGDQGRLDNLKGNMEKINSDIADAERDGKVDEVEKLKKELADRTAEAKEVQDRIDQATAESEEARERSGQAEEHSKEYPEEKEPGPD